MEYRGACERWDFKTARPAGMGSFDNAELYLNYLEHLDLPKAEMKKVFADGDDVYEFHETNVENLPEPMLVFTWIHVDGGKISSIKMLYDPRPFCRKDLGDNGAKVRIDVSRFVKYILEYILCQLTRPVYYVLYIVKVCIYPKKDRLRPVGLRSP